MQVKHLKYIYYFLFVLIIFLGIKIFNLRIRKIQGVYVTRINRDDIVFSSDSSHLKYFYELKPNSVETWKPDWLGYEVKNSINFDSLNERKEYSVQKPPDTYRIITLGDSWTFGQYVNTPENYSEVLEDYLNNKLDCRKFNQFEVINLGVYNYDIEYAIARFQKRGIKYNPDLVIWLMNVWNFEKINELYIPAQAKYYQEGIKSFDPNTQTFPAHQKFVNEIKQKYGDNYFLTYQKDILSSFIKIYNRQKFLIISFPSMRKQYKDLIRDLIKDTNFQYYDDITDITKINDLQLLDHHPNKAGHIKIATDILGYLLKKEFKECIYN